MSELQVQELEAEKEVRAFILDENLAADELAVQRGKVFDAGFSRVEFPEGLGGRAWPRVLQRIVDRVLAEEAAFEPLSMSNSPIAVGMGAPTVLAHGHPDVKHRLIREIYTGEAAWCQMFSEPSAGSDVAGLSTRAVRDGDNWVITGQKVWTSWAHLADYGLLLARTDPSVSKHEGLSYFFVDMKDSAVEVRPLFQLTGGTDFNEVFLNGVVVPAENLLGEVGGGWKVATTTLMNERDAIGGLTSFTDKTIERWRERRDSLGGRAETMRDELVQLWMEDTAVALTSAAGRKKAASGRPGAEGSVAKQAGAELQQRILEFDYELAGAEGLVIPEGYPMQLGGQNHGGSAARSYLAGRALTIAGGTSEVMRNILAERVLRMPADLRVDKDVPWDQIPRG